MLIWIRPNLPATAFTANTIIFTPKIEESVELDDDGYEVSISSGTYIEMILNSGYCSLNNTWYCGTPVLF